MNSSRGTATSAIWNVTYPACRTTLAPILISFSGSVLPLIHRFRESLRGGRFERFKLPKNAHLTISGGLASFPEDASTVQELIARADEALLRAKAEGKNCIYLGGENGGPALGSEAG